MMRKCHLNTCPVGIATQDPVLRERFKGQPEHVVNFFFFVAEELRGIMASLGIRTLNEMIGRTELLQSDDAIKHWKAQGLDLSHLLHFPSDVDPQAPRHRTTSPPAVLEDHLDWGLVEQAKDAINAAQPVVIEQSIRNVARCSGGILSSHVAARYGQAGLPDNTITVNFKGSAGQSFGGWLAHGITFVLEGDANDYTARASRAASSPCVRRRMRRTCRRTTSSSATRCSTARRRAVRSSAARRASASRSATPAPRQWSRASATMAAST